MEKHKSNDLEEKFSDDEMLFNERMTKASLEYNLNTPTTSNNVVETTEMNNLENLATIESACINNKQDLSVFLDKNPLRLSANCMLKCVPLLPQLVVFSLTSTFLCGYHLVVLNTSKKYFTLDFEWCKNYNKSYPTESFSSCTLGNLYGTFLNTSLFIGATIGSAIGGGLITIGRRRCLILTHIIFILGTIIAVISEGFLTLLFSRIIVGVAVGFSTIFTGIWIAENSPKNVRGFWGSFIKFSIALGVIVANLMGLAFEGYKMPNANSPKEMINDFQRIWWRAMVGLGLIPSVLAMSFALFAYKHDTPYYLIENGEEKTALLLIKEINKKNDLSDAAEEVESIGKAIKDSKLCESSAGWRDLCANTRYFRVTAIACVLSAGQQLVGISVLISKSNALYRAIGASDGHITVLSVVLSLVNLLFGSSALLTMDKLGRRVLLLWGTIGMCASLCCIATIFHAKPYIASQSVLTALNLACIACTYTYVALFSMSYGPVIWIFLFEIFPLQIKKKATALSMAVNYASAVVIVLPMDYCLEALDSKTVFTFFAVTSALLTSFIFIFVKETKGRAIHDSPY